MQNGYERVSKALELLTDGFCSYVEHHMKEIHKEGWIDAARESFHDSGGQAFPEDAIVRWDAHSLLTVTWNQWNEVFRHRLGYAERSLISELRDFRNRWAHQGDFDFDDTYRVLDSVHRLLKAISADEAELVEREKRELMIEAVTEETNAALRRAAVRRERWVEIVVYLTCCTALVYVIIREFGWAAWLMALLVCILFVHLIHRRLSLKPQIGPHECKRCRKIIYSLTCPYCQSSGSNHLLK